MASSHLIEAIAVTTELLGRTFSPAAARMFATDLGTYPEAQVLAALTRCRREVRGALTIADVVSRLDDGRPGPDEAWAMLPRNEAQTIVWTVEMSEAWGICAPLLEAGDMTAARMAFRECYNASVTRARAEHRAPHWQISPGTDPHGRVLALLDATEKGRLTASQVDQYLPHQVPTAEGLAMLAKVGVVVKTISKAST